MLDTNALRRKGFSYVGHYTQNKATHKRYSTVHSLNELTTRLNDKQYCYTDSESALRCIIATLSAYGTVRAVQLSHNSFLVAWAKARPKIRENSVLYTDIDKHEYDWS